MKVHTQGFKEQIKEMGKELDSKITYSLNGENIELGSEELNSITPHYEANILKSVMKQLDVDSNVDIPLGTIINYKFGLKVNDEYEYINYGNYIVYSSERQEDTLSYKIICYDKMLWSMKPYESFVDEYPISINNYINKLCQKLGLVFKSKNDNYANKNKMIENELYLDNEGNSLDYTYRDVFDELAQVTASTIVINEDTDEVEIRYINDTNDTIDEEYLKDVNVNFGEKYGPINSIVLSRSAESDNVYLQNEQSVTANGLCELKIIDNQIMNFNNRSEFLPDILEKLNGLEYYINNYSSTGIMYYNVCDKYNVSIDENIYNCIMFNDEPNITQGLEEKIYCNMPDESKTDYTKSDKEDRKINQAYLIVDKQNKVIEAVVSEQKDIEKEMTVTKQANGNPIEVTDAGEYPLESIGIDGKSYQEGTPTPTNSKEIKTVQGITNEFDKSKCVREQYVSGVVGQPDTTVAGTTRIFNKGKEVKPNMEVSFSLGTTKTLRYWLVEIDSTNKIVKVNTVTTNADTTIVTTSTTARVEVLICWQATNNTITLEDIEDSNIILVEGKLPKRYVPHGRWLEQIAISEDIHESKLEIGDILTRNGQNDSGTGNIYSRSVGYYEVDSNHLYEIVAPTSVNQVVVYEYDENKKYINWSVSSSNKHEFKTSEACKYIRYRVRTGDITTKVELHKINTALIDMNKPNEYDKETDIELDGQYRGYKNGDIATNKDYYGIKVAVKPNTLYSTDGNSLYSNLCYFNESFEFISGIVYAYNYGHNTFTTPSNCYWITLAVNKNNTDFKIYEGYEPYYELAEVGDTRDKFLNGTLTKKIGKYIFTGDESFQGTDPFYTPLSNIKKDNSKVVILSTHFIGSSNDDRSKGSNIVYSEGICVYFRHTSFTTVNEFKTFLKEQYNAGTPVIVYYVLAEPQTYELKYEHLKLHKGYNYITLNDELYPSMEIEYLTDSTLNATYATHAELKIESDKITSEVANSTKVLGKEIESAKSEMEQTADGFNFTVSKLTSSMNDLSDDVKNSTQNMAQTISSMQQTINEDKVSFEKQIKEIDERGVEKIKTSKGFTFDNNGVTIDSSDSNVASNLDIDGLKVIQKSDGKKLLEAVVDDDGQGKVITANLTVTNYCIVGKHGRFEEYTEPSPYNANGVGFFLI